MNEFTVLIRKNNFEKSFVERLKADLSQEQAKTLASSLNGAFASQGVNWYAVIQEREE